jgi:hypothetical protein
MIESVVSLLAPVVLLALTAVTAVAVVVWGYWLRARRGKAPIPYWRLAGMIFRRLSLRSMVDGWIMAVHGGIDARLSDLETHYRAGGRVERTVLAAVAARKAGIEFPFSMARAMDLSDRDVVDVVYDLIRSRREDEHKRAGETTCERVTALIGNEGDVSVAVGPPGIVQVQGVSVTAVSDGGFLPKGTKVRIVSVSGNMAVVRRVTDV